MSELEILFRKHGSDKAEHGYHAVYETLPEPRALLEIGVFKGASLRAWREFWPHADILGADTFTRCPCPDDFPPMGRPAVVQADSRTDVFRKYYDGDGPDLIIDDGSHKPLDQAATLRNLWPVLAPGGRYFIEDVLIVGGDCLIPAWFIPRRSDYNRGNYLALMNTCQRLAPIPPLAHDFRHISGKPDSVMLELRKPE